MKVYCNTHSQVYVCVLCVPQHSVHAGTCSPAEPPQYEEGKSPLLDYPAPCDPRGRSLWLCKKPVTLNVFSDWWWDDFVFMVVQREESVLLQWWRSDSALDVIVFHLLVYSKNTLLDTGSCHVASENHTGFPETRCKRFLLANHNMKAYVLTRQSPSCDWRHGWGKKCACAARDLYPW